MESLFYTFAILFVTGLAGTIIVGICEYLELTDEDEG